MAYADEGFNEHTEIWGLGDMDCTLFGEDLWKEWKQRVAEKVIEEKLHENRKKIKENNRKLWNLGNMEFWSTGDDDDENGDDDDDDENATELELEQYFKIAEIVTENCDNVKDELWDGDDDDDDDDEEKKKIKKEYNKKIKDYLEGVEIVFSQK
jgi:hypothetical protein